MIAVLRKKIPDLIAEINRYKWIESEKLGHDIGMERALREWMSKHYAGWLKAKCSARGRGKYYKSSA